MKIAVVLFNLGGPDGPAAVRPFLYNLFRDKAIIRLPFGVRHGLAWLIARGRAPVARAIYDKIGGGSPILANTEAQARALEAALSDLGAVKCFIAMRYWHPFTEVVAKEVAAFQADVVVQLPLYPQFSTTTTGSSLAAFGRTSKPAMPGPTGSSQPDLLPKVERSPVIKTICCYPEETGFIAALAAQVKAAYQQMAAQGKAPRVLFSAHGLPERIVKAGDPYQWQCERTAAALAAAVGVPGLDWVLCYQSRVGRLEWIKPATDAEIRRAGAEGVALVVAPIAFVSEHSETLVELDIEYRHLAKECGVPDFACVPTVGTAPDFIEGLAQLVRRSVAGKADCISDQGGRICPRDFSGCWMKDQHNVL